MQPSDREQAKITETISILQDAIRKESFDPKAVRANIVKAANLLLGILGLPGVAPDGGGGSN
jgi:hypothetical protein